MPGCNLPITSKKRSVIPFSLPIPLQDNKIIFIILLSLFPYQQFNINYTYFNLHYYFRTLWPATLSIILQDLWKLDSGLCNKDVAWQVHYILKGGELLLTWNSDIYCETIKYWPGKIFTKRNTDRKQFFEYKLIYNDIAGLAVQASG